MRIDWLSLRVWAANMVGQVGLAVIHGWYGSDRQIPDQRPSPPAAPTVPPQVPSMPKQRDVTVDDATLDTAEHDAMLALARLSDESRWGLLEMGEVIALERQMQAPAAEVRRK